ncbi:MAG: NUDIX domain-containing protein [Candidatus Paceibacterota bacterium]|jgi:ADP-ribose pyrophosphatase YjhB (NUDIX family)|nr:NUDIX domain-containing protein [Candidatus Paceibacterota bacterium]MDD4831211.1 NUDIX domain-containing protein [Candidatus Paceibacterota bacterium]MDD4875100.1 NUDIX domain-containing protein [Candidatus Paceibacterota bacterium]
MLENEKKVLVGLGVIILRDDGKILIGKRKGKFVPEYSIPGGHLDMGETFEEGASREVKEETGMEIKNPKVVSVSNNLETYKKTGRHYISVNLLATEFKGEPKVMEPDKCSGYIWCDPKKVPEPHFEASRRGLEMYFKKQIS